MCGKKGHKHRDCPQNQQHKGKGAHGRSHGQTPIQQQQSTSGPARQTRSKTASMAIGSSTPRAIAYKTALKAVGTETEPPAPQASTLNDKYVCMTTATCTFDFRGRRCCQWITGSPRRCSTRFYKTLVYRALHSGASAGTRATVLAWRFRRHLLRWCHVCAA